MALPSNYTRVGNFTNDESSSASGRSTVKTAVLDSELNTIATIIADINTNIGYAIRSDGQIKDSFVKPHGFGIVAATGFLKYDSSSSTWSFVADPTADATAAKNDAQKLATNPEDSQYTLSDGTTGYSALHYSAKASTSSTSAASSSTTASSKATEAENWATKTDGVVPSTSEYSAKEYSQGSQASTGGSAKNWATQTGADVTGASAGSMSAKEWSVGTLGRGVAGEGSAKDWATRTGATVDDADYSAKEHAVGSTVAGGSSKDWATKSEDSVVSSGSYSAKHWSAKAQGYADQAASGTGWFSEAATVAYVSGTSFTVSGDVTGVYVANRRLNMTVGGSSVFSHITSSSYSAPNTTVNINDSVLTASLTAVKYSVVFGGNTGNINPHSHNDDENGGIIQQLDWLESSVVSNTVRILESDGLSMVHTTAGLVDEFESNTAAETAIDASASTGEQYDSSADCYQQVPGSTGLNSDKDYTVESSYIQQEWDENVVGANATFTNGSATVTTTGTFPTNATAGRISQDGSNWYAISSRDSATQITLASNFAQSTVTGTFTIRMSQFTGGVVKLSDASSFFLGDGRDGSVTITSAKNINTDVIGSSRSTNADGIVTTVSSNPTGTSISVASITGFADGDKLLLMNLQGGSGDVADVGNYEILTVDGTPTGTTINVVETISKSYDGSSFGSQKVICQRIPQWSTVAVNSGGSITCSAFDGSKGGVVICYATGSITLASGTTIHADAKGYRGSLNWQPSSYGQGFSYVGEGRTGQQTLRQQAANDCGGGAGGNTNGTHGWDGGGAGGGHSSAGTNGVTTSYGGTGGNGGSTWGDAALTQIGFGGGGGQGGRYNSTGSTLGGAGGGAVYLICDTLTTTSGGLIQANGEDHILSAGNQSGSGGGAGGTVWIDANTITAGANDINATGGSGGTGFTAPHGNGGDGGTGFVRLQYTTINSQSFENDTEENSVCDPDPTGSTGSTASTGISTSINNSEYVSIADSFSQSTSVSTWSDINSSTITETLNSQNAYYWVIFSAVSGYGAGTEVKVFNQTGSVWRKIVKNNAGIFQYNNSAAHDAAESWVNSTTNDLLFAVSQAISAQASNRMTGTEAAAISDAEWAATNGFSSSSDTLLTRGLTLYSASSSQNPEVSQFQINYDLGNQALDLRTKIWNGSSGMPTAPTAITTVYAFFIDNGVAATYYYTIDGTNFVEISSFDDTWIYASGKTARRKTISLPGGVGTDPRVKVVVAQGSSIFKLHALGLQVR